VPDLVPSSFASLSRLLVANPPDGWPARSEGLLFAYAGPSQHDVLPRERTFISSRRSCDWTLLKLVSQFSQVLHSPEEAFPYLFDRLFNQLDFPHIDIPPPLSSHEDDERAS